MKHSPLSTKRPVLTCSECGKRKPHNVVFRPDFDLNDTSLVSSCCNVGKVMGIIQMRMIAAGIPAREARKIEMVYWEIHEPFSSMTPTEKGYVLSSRGVKIDYVQAYTGHSNKAIERAIAKEELRHKAILDGTYWKKPSLKASAR